MNENDLLNRTCSCLFDEYPFARDFFSSIGLAEVSLDRQVIKVLEDYQSALESDDEDQAEAQPLVDRFLTFMETMESLKREITSTVACITVLGGKNKLGRPESIQLNLFAGEVIAVVGPTGAGKSLLLADVECLAQGDTPSGRRILIDNRTPDDVARLSGEQRLVAQLSQNMNFVMDVSVRDFVALHAESRLLEHVDQVVGQVYELAVGLAGEPFDLETPVTALSGGQSRALMIADVACLSRSPIVLIDEIENAGVDRRRALDLLVKKEKIVLMATHDPLLALSADRRLVIRHGGITAVLTTTPEEKQILDQLDALDARLFKLRHRIRQGDHLDGSIFPTKE